MTEEVEAPQARSISNLRISIHPQLKKLRITMIPDDQRPGFQLEIEAYQAADLVVALAEAVMLMGGEQSPHGAS